MRKILKLRKKLKGKIAHYSQLLRTIRRERAELSAQKSRLDEAYIESRRILASVKLIHSEQLLESSERVRAVARRGDSLHIAERALDRAQTRVM